jgi:hypothetical protein
MTAMTKTQMVNACADYEVEWFFQRTEDSVPTPPTAWV